MRPIRLILLALTALASAAIVHAGYGVPTTVVTVNTKTGALIFPTAAQFKSANGIGAGGGTWGSITGTLSNQTDLNTALGLKLSTATAATTYQPLDSDLSAIAALGTTTFGRSVLALADAAASRTLFGVVIGTDVQAYNAKLAAIAALANGSGYLFNNGSGVFSYGTPSGAGNVSNTGTPTSGQIASWTSATVIQGVGATTLSDSILGGLATNGFVKRTGSNAYSIDTSTYLTANQSISFSPTGDVSSSGGSGTTSLTPALTVTKINGVSMAGLATGIVKNTTTTGVPSIAIASDFPTLNQNTTGSAATLTTSRTIAITGDLAYTSASFNGSGNVTAAGTLATVNSNVGSFTNANITVNAKGLVTAAANGTAGAGDVVAANQNALTYHPSTVGTSLATGSQTAAVGGSYYTTLTSNLTVTSFTGTPVSNSVITFELNGCNGTATFTFPSSKRRGDADSATTTITPTAGNHFFRFQYNLANTTWYYTDTVTGPLNLAGGSTAVTGTLPVANGGTGINSLGTGVATALGINVGSAGAPVVLNGAGGSPTSITLPSAATGTTQTAGDTSTKIATTAYADTATLATHLGTFASPNTAAGSITWTAPVYDIYTSASAALRTYTLPAASSYTGKAFILFVVAGTNHVNVQPASGAQLVLAGVLLTANHYAQAATSAAGNYICFRSDGTNWVSLGSSGTWADATSP